MSRCRSRTLTDARPRLVDAICREIARRRLTCAQVSALYEGFHRGLMSDLNVARHSGDFTNLGADRLFGIAEALQIDTQPLLYPPARVERMAA